MAYAERARQLSAQAREFERIDKEFRDATKLAGQHRAASKKDLEQFIGELNTKFGMGMPGRGIEDKYVSDVAMAAFDSAKQRRSLLQYQLKNDSGKIDASAGGLAGGAGGNLGGGNLGNGGLLGQQQNQQQQQKTEPITLPTFKDSGPDGKTPTLPVGDGLNPQLPQVPKDPTNPITDKPGTDPTTGFPSTNWPKSPGDSSSSNSPQTQLPAQAGGALGAMGGYGGLDPTMMMMGPLLAQAAGRQNADMGYQPYGREPRPERMPQPVAPQPVSPPLAVPPQPTITPASHATTPGAPVAAGGAPLPQPNSDGGLPYKFKDNRTVWVPQLVYDALHAAEINGADAQTAYMNSSAKWTDATQVGEPKGPDELITGDVAIWGKRTTIVVKFAEDGKPETLVEGKLRLVEDEAAEQSAKNGDSDTGLSFQRPKGVTAVAQGDQHAPGPAHDPNPAAVSTIGV
ncbi:hypothetical protein D5S18_00870 [Nocardia panacis]|uniref:Uncharacterized protein n=1 Tax=Nocardia panacis TaxID=2340916 RepID=A0A3A4KG19_9NOCA|nr:hypothetical protein [Nocardia panacis]RJO79859.1 hypothetical protein D5S18_00870 [Nocardia panacis]